MNESMRVFFFDKLGRIEKRSRENDSAIALKGRDIFPLKTIFRIYEGNDVTASWAFGQARARASASSNLKLPSPSLVRFYSGRTRARNVALRYAAVQYALHYPVRFLEGCWRGIRNRIGRRAVSCNTSPNRLSYDALRYPLRASIAR